MVFLNEYLSKGAWSGICETGLETMPLENEAWRRGLIFNQTYTVVKVDGATPKSWLGKGS